MKNEISILLTLLMLIFGCSSSEESKLVGKWQHTNDQMFSCEFSADKTGSMKWADGSGKQLQAPIKWSMVKGSGKVTVEADLGNGVTTGVFDFREEKLISPGGLDVYSKVK